VSERERERERGWCRGGGVGGGGGGLARRGANGQEECEWLEQVLVIPIYKQRNARGGRKSVACEYNRRLFYSAGKAVDDDALVQIARASPCV
jgi:hypothetical protein